MYTAETQHLETLTLISWSNRSHTNTNIHALTCNISINVLSYSLRINIMRAAIRKEKKKPHKRTHTINILTPI